MNPDRDHAASESARELREDGAQPGGESLETVAETARVYTASQWQLMWWKFRKHRLARWSVWAILALYLAAAFCEFLSPYTAGERNVAYAFAPPQRVHFLSSRGFPVRPFVYGLKGARHPETLQRVYAEDEGRAFPIRFLVRGSSYRFWGVFATDWHLFGVDKGATIYLLGADALGGDLLSRILYGGRVSLTVGLVGVALSLVLGLVIGAISGYHGGWVDHVIQRGIEILRSFPSIPLWMGLAAALPADWSQLQVYVGITVVLSFVGWTGLAREVRGKILALREEDFATAAMFAGASQWRIIWRHLLPSCMSHIIVTLTLAVPAMILGETTLSFLGLGLRPPVVSWGVLLQDAQNVRTIAMCPWLLMPVFFVIVTVLAFNFLGDGLRDAADPYAR